MSRCADSHLWVLCSAWISMRKSVLIWAGSTQYALGCKRSNLLVLLHGGSTLSQHTHTSIVTQVLAHVDALTWAFSMTNTCVFLIKTLKDHVRAFPHEIHFVLWLPRRYTNTINIKIMIIQLPTASHNLICTTQTETHAQMLFWNAKRSASHSLNERIAGSLVGTHASYTHKPRLVSRRWLQTNHSRLNRRLKKVRSEGRKSRKRTP